MNPLKIFAFGALLGFPLAAQDGSDQEFRKRFASILPREEELAWQNIAWRSTLGDALAEARENDKPILLWAMNGHPLACT